MLGDAVDHPLERQPSSAGQVSSPLSAQILEFCESDLFPETLQDSEVASSSNGGCYEDHSSFCCYPPDVTKSPASTLIADNSTTTKLPPTTTNIIDTNNFSIIFDEEITDNNDIDSVKLDFTNSHHPNLEPYQFEPQEQFDLTLFENQMQILQTTDHCNMMNGPILPYTHPLPNDHVVPVFGQTALLPNVHQDDYLSSMPPSKLMRLNNHPSFSSSSSSPNCSFMDPSLNSYLSRNSNPPLPLEDLGIFNANLFLGELQGDNNINTGGIFCPNLSLSRPYNATNELQAHSYESQHLVNINGGGSCTPLASEITSLEADTYRVTNKLTTEERKEKINRYMKKRNQRNFTKKIKYACRKTLADSRPRVRGRFAKNDEFGDNVNNNNRTTCCSSNRELEDTDEDVKSYSYHVRNICTWL